MADLDPALTPVSPIRTFDSLRFRTYRVFFLGQLVSQVGSWARMIATTLLVLALTDDGVAVGTLMACQFLPMLVIGAWAGLVADRSDKRKLLLVVQACLMLQSFVLAALAAMGDPPVGALYAVALVGGVAGAFDNPVRRSFIVEMVPASHVVNAVSLNTAVMTCARIVGPLIAGLLVSTVGYAWCFLLDAFSYIAVLGGLWRMRVDELRRAPLTSRGGGQVREGLRYVRSKPDLFVPLMMMAVIGTLAYQFQVVLPLFVTRTLDGSDVHFTLLFAALSVGSMAGALWSAQRRAASVRQIVAAALAFGASLQLLAVVPNLAAAFPVALFVGGSSVLFVTASTTTLQLSADPRMQGRVLALQAMVFLGCAPIGAPVVGAVCEAFGPRFGLTLGAGACVAAAVYGRSSKPGRPSGISFQTTT